MADEQHRVCIWLDSLLPDASNATTQDSGASKVGTQDLEAALTALKSNIMTWSDVRELAGVNGDTSLAGAYGVRYIPESYF